MARARVEALRERAREFIRIAGLWDVRHQPAGKTVRRPAEADPVRLHADAGAQTHSARRADGGHQSETDRACRREHPLRQQKSRRQLPGDRAQHRRRHQTSASGSSCSTRAASSPKGHPTKSFATRRCGRPISVVDPNLSIKGLRAGYGSLDILNGVDLDVPQGQFVALMGPNGAGKSTLLKTLYGMTTIKEGSIELAGQEYRRLQVAGDPCRRHRLRAAGPLQFSGHDDRRKSANGRLHAARCQGRSPTGTMSTICFRS